MQSAKDGKPTEPGRACPICGARRAVPFNTEIQPSTLICEACRHVFWDAAPDPAELESFYRDRYADNCRQREIQEGNRAYYRRHAAELAQLAGVDVGAASIVEFGSSFPTFLAEARAAGYKRCTGIEWTREAIEYGRAHGVEMLQPDRLGELPNGGFDILRMVHVLEHLLDPLTTLVEGAAKLRRGGLVHISQPNFPVLAARPTSVVLKDSVYPEHLHFFNPISLCVMAARAGLKVTRFVTFDEEEKAHEAYGSLLDTAHATRALPHLPVEGPHSLGRFPYFLGANSALYAVKT